MKEKDKKIEDKISIWISRAKMIIESLNNFNRWKFNNQSRI